MPSLLKVAECQKDMFESAAAYRRFGFAGSRMSTSRPNPPHAPPAKPAGGYSVMSWHCCGPGGIGGPARPPPPPPPRPPRPPPAAAPPRPPRPAAVAARSSRFRRRTSVAPRSSRGRPEFRFVTTVAAAGFASGTLMTSILNNWLFGSASGDSAEHPASLRSVSAPQPIRKRRCRCCRIVGRHEDGMRVRPAACLHAMDVLRFFQVRSIENSNAAEPFLADRVLHAL